MIGKRLPFVRKGPSLHALRDMVNTLSRYVVDARPWGQIEQGREVTLELTLTQIKSLARYALDVAGQGVEPGDKVTHSGTRNLLSRDLAGQQVEMLAVASMASRVKHAMEHIIVSWPTGELPTPDQVEATVDVVLRTLELTHCPAIYAEHANTANRHLHLAVVRIDPVTGRAAGSKFMTQDLHQAIAIVEESQGWRPERGSLYLARQGAVYDRASGVLVRDASGALKISRGDRSKARELGAPSHLSDNVAGKRDAIVAASVAADSWADFHHRLARMEVLYRRHGSGARVHVGQESFKASEVGRSLALRELEDRWDAYQCGVGPSHKFDRYSVLVAEQRRRLRTERDAAGERLRQQLVRNLRLIAATDTKPIATGMKAEHASAETALTTAYKDAIKECTAQHFKTEDAWCRSGSPGAPAHVSGPSLLLPNSTGPESAWVPIQALRREVDGWATHYLDEAKHLIFSDWRQVIIVHQNRHEVGLDAALQIAAQRWGTVRVTGSAQFASACAQRATLLGIRVVDRDGQPLKPASTVRVSGSPAAVEPMGEQRMPDYRQDPTRQITIARLLDELGEMGDLLTRRRTHGPDTGRLELVIEADHPSQVELLRSVARFEQDQIVQMFLETRRAATLESAEELLVVLSVPLIKAEIVTVLGSWGNFARAVFLAFDDVDFRAMVERVAARREKHARSGQVVRETSAEPRGLDEVGSTVAQALADRRDDIAGARRRIANEGVRETQVTPAQVAIEQSVDRTARDIAPADQAAVLLWVGQRRAKLMDRWTRSRIRNRADAATPQRLGMDGREEAGSGPTEPSGRTNPGWSR